MKKQKTALIVCTLFAFLMITIATRTYSSNEKTMPFPEFDLNQAHNPFSFLVYGDVQNVANNGHRKLVDQMMQQPAAFIMNTGDISPDKGENLDGQFHSEIFDLAGRIPFFPASGNHDVNFHSEESRYSFRNYFRNAFDYLSGQSLNSHLSDTNNNQRLWYAFRYATALFIVLDSNLLIDSGKYRDTHSLPAYQGYAADQFRWVQEVLKKSDEDPGIKSKFVFFHHSPFLSKENKSVLGFGGHEDDRTLMVNYGISSTAGGDPQYLLDLFRRHGVTAVFSGHEHYYERWRETIDEGNGNIRNLNWVIVGSGGVKPRRNLKHGDDDVLKLFEEGELYDRYLDRIANIDSDWSAQMSRDFPTSQDRSGDFQNFLIVDVDGSEIGFRTIDTEGRLRDSGFFSR